MRRTTGAITITEGNATAHEPSQAASHLPTKPTTRPTACQVATPDTSSDIRPESSSEKRGCAKRAGSLTIERRRQCGAARSRPRLRSTELVGRLERGAIGLPAVQLGLVPAELLAQLDDVADDDEGGRLEAGLLGQRRQRVEVAGDDALRRQRAVLDDRRRRVGREAVLDQRFAQERQALQAHVDDDRLVAAGDALPV